MRKINNAKRFFKNISFIVVPLVVSTFSLVLYDKYLDSEIASRYNSALGRTYGVDEMNKGIKILDQNAERGDLIILGSSELDSQVPQNPQNMFPNTVLNCEINLVGRALVQSLLNGIKVGALNHPFKGQKIVLIVSLQWFLEDDIDTSGFKSNFSEVQFYKFMSDKSIDNDDKIYLCQRIRKLLKNDSNFCQPYLYAYLFSSNNFLSSASFECVRPYYFLREKFLELKDKHQALKKIKEFENCPVKNEININWEDEYTKAEQMGRNECTNNDFYVYDEYYTTYLESKMDTLKDSQNPNLDLCRSKEIDDYKWLMKIFKKHGISPYIVITSTNGKYYDYIGINREKRVAFYDEIRRITEGQGFDYLDLKDKEYTPYFYRDVMHLGWKGWLYVNEKIVSHYS